MVVWDCSTPTHVMHAPMICSDACGACMQGMNGQLEFFNADDFEPMSAAEHFMCTDIEWDPTGRFVATSVGHVHQMENGFNLWLFNGQELYQ